VIVWCLLCLLLRLIFFCCVLSCFSAARTMLIMSFVGILVYMFEMSNEHRRMSLFIFMLCRSLMRCGVSFMLKGEGSWMYCFSICVRYVANLYAGELHQLITGRINIGFL
jgi:hypothetical protein